MWSRLLKLLRRLHVWGAKHWKALVVCAVPLVGFLVLDMFFPLPRTMIENDYSVVYLDRRGTLMHVSLSPSDSFRVRLDLREMSPYLVKGFLLYEDRYYYFHPGVNPVSVCRAVWLNLRHKSIKSGASTISMQVARMIEQRPRKMTSKLIEMFRAVQLEIHYTKKQLLENYLNMVPMGGNIRGVGAASYFYFGKPASEINLAEAALLIGLPNSPENYRPDRFPDSAIRQQRKVLERIAHAMRLDRKRIEEQLAMEIHLGRLPNPYRCPHLIEAEKYGPRTDIRQFTIDLRIQDYCEELLNQKLAQNRKEGIYNAAILVTDNRTSEVLAYVGSPDYFDKEHSGQVNACRIPRSPGSTLKPFLYERAFENGVLTPYALVYDIPRKFGSFDPVNFIQHSVGPLTASDALVRSLNIPAIRLENDLGPNGLAGFLKSITTLPNAGQIDLSGLTITLGGFNLSLEQLTELYMTLASGGLNNQLRYYLKERETKPRRLMSEAGCFMVSEILSDYERPDLPYNWDFTTYLAKVALKTGTSFGLRDAWCFAYNPRYTVGVWFGNVNCVDSDKLVGIRKAAPVAINIFDHLTRNSDEWYKKPFNVSTRKICAVSGCVPGPWCTHLRDDLYIPGVSSMRTCPVHKEIFIRKSDGRSVCSACMSGETNQYTRKVVEIWPPEVAGYLRERGMKVDTIPPHNLNCVVAAASDIPEIISPQGNTEYSIEGSKPLKEQKIPLKAFAGQDTDRLYWFLGKRLVAEGKPNETCYLVPQRGDWNLTVTDSHGRSSSIRLIIN